MACRGLVQRVLQLPYSVPQRTARSTCLSREKVCNTSVRLSLLIPAPTARSFQDLARSRGENPVRASRQIFRTLPQCTLSRAIHASARACADSNIDVDRSHEPQVAVAASDQGGNMVRKVLGTSLSRAMIPFMRSVPQPVAIVTAADTNQDPEGGPDSWRGATISSFNTVTLDPEPIISFNIKKISSTFDAIQSSSRFWVHFLTPSPSSAQLAHIFTQGNNQRTFEGLRVSYTEEKRARIPQIRGISGSLGRHEGPQIAFVLVCSFLEEKTVIIGDHVVLFATVTGINRMGPALRETAVEGMVCLAYANQGYHGLKHLELPLRKTLTMGRRPPQAP
jgi:flavin reductase (DIM6/NTAB) family NADH-FMN oxidoreductase RutF